MSHWCYNCSCTTTDNNHCRRYCTYSCFRFNSHVLYIIFYNACSDENAVEVTFRNVDGCYVTKIFSQDLYVRTVIKRGFYDASFGPVDLPIQKYKLTMNIRPCR